MKFTSAIVRFAFGISATVAVAACSTSQPQFTSIPSAPGGQSAARTVGMHAPAVPATSWKFKTIDNTDDLTFNQLLGINDDRTISGYFGSGATGHPNKGYTVVPPYKQANFTNENYPGSYQTQVTCIDNLGNTGGFWIDTANVNRGFIEWNGVFTSYTDPKTGKGTVNQILGLNDAGTAVGFYTDAKGVNHGFMLNQATGKFKPVTPPGATNVTASAINNLGDIVGFYGPPSASIGFLYKNGSFSTFSYPNSSATVPAGVNDHDAIVGGYTASSAMHVFLLTNPLKHATFTTIDSPKGIGTTTLNGINNRTNMVGFYVDSSGNTDGLLVERKK
jgi:hypothetical protein